MRIGLAQRALRPLGERGRRLLLYRVLHRLYDEVDFGVADAAAAREQVGDGGLVGEIDRHRASRLRVPLFSLFIASPLGFLTLTCICGASALLSLSLCSCSFAAATAASSFCHMPLRAAAVAVAPLAATASFRRLRRSFHPSSPFCRCGCCFCVLIG